MTKLVTVNSSPIPAAQSRVKRLFAYLSQDNDIYRFFRNNIAASYQREESLVHLWMGIVLLIALSFLAINHFVLHFTSLPQVFISMFTYLPAILGLWWVIGHVHRASWPRFGLFATTFANLSVSALIFLIAWAGIVTTPFVIIDYHLAQWDRWLGFDVLQFMAWAQQFPALIKVLYFCYYSWQFQIVLAPLLLAVLNKSREINHYLISSAICFIICITIYYFFPTIAPAGIMHSAYFTSDQYHLVTRFYEVHQSLPISFYDGGIISFPSGHVIFSLLVLISLRQVKWVFYPMLVINFFLIMATMALGYHYLVDVLASFIIVALVVTTMHYYFKKC